MTRAATPQPKHWVNLCAGAAFLVVMFFLCAAWWAVTAPWRVLACPRKATGGE